MIISDLILIPVAESHIKFFKILHVILYLNLKDKTIYIHIYNRKWCIMWKKIKMNSENCVDWSSVQIDKDEEKESM